MTHLVRKREGRRHDAYIQRTGKKVITPKFLNGVEIVTFQ
jgi:hypothetical protein